MKISRRNFLQSASLSIASLGGFWQNFGISKSQLNAYSATLNTSTSRKLALLVGINEYSQDKSLKGCVTDVELQKELLIYRFGFKAEDIIILTDHEATRENILTSFDEHLIQQAQNNDIVIFHFSGYGRQVKFHDKNNDFTLKNSLITYDSIKSQNGFSDDILLDTFNKLGQLLKTNKYTFIFDSSFIFTSENLPHQLLSRSYNNKNILIISEQEIIFNKNLETNYKNQYLQGNKNHQLSPFILSPFMDSLAVEINSVNFNVGLFSYNLTQNLWKVSPNIKQINFLKKIASQMVLYSGDNPSLSFTNKNKTDQLSFYFPLEFSGLGDAIITNIIEPNLVELELVGLPLIVLLNYNINSCFTYKINEETKITIQINSITGNKAKGTLLDSDKTLEKGLILKESIRIIKKNVALNIAFNNTLEKIEKVDAISALSSINEIESIVNIGENLVDLILGKLAHKNDQIDGYGLYSATGILLSKTYPKVNNEAVSSAIKRLIPSLKIALTKKILRLTYNQYSSDLPVNINLLINYDKKTFIINEKTIDSNFKNQKDIQEKLETSNIDNNLFVNIPFGGEFSLEINNNYEYDLYYLLLGINSSKQAIIYYSPDNFIINRTQTMNIPKNLNSLKWIVTDKGMGELILICAKFPFNKTLNQLYSMTPEIKMDQEQVILIENPVIIAKSILEDLHFGSNISNNIISNLSDVYALDLKHWVTFNFFIESL